MNKDVNYTFNHKAVPNGVGDFDMICPELGKVFFIPIMMRRDVFCTCPCGKEIKRENNNE